MDSLESELLAGIGLLEQKIKRVETISQIMESISEITLARKTPSEVYDLEEYYASQINKWIISYERKTQEIEKQEKLLQETQIKYLASLRKIKELENEIQTINEKYMHYKLTQQTNKTQEN